MAYAQEHRSEDFATRRSGRGGEESLIILASPLQCDYTETLYRKRLTLETAFRGRLKSAGFNMEETHLNQTRFENMLVLLMIAFGAAFIEGLAKIESLPIPLMKNCNIRRISIFRYGYVCLLHDFWNTVKNESANLCKNVMYYEVNYKCVWVMPLMGRGRWG